MNIVEMYNAQKYDDIMQEYFENVRIRKIKPHKQNAPIQLLELKFTMLTSYKAGYYFDYLELCKKAISEVPFSNEFWSPQDRVCIAEASLDSLLFCLFNKKECKLQKMDIIKSLENVIAKLPELYKNASIQLNEFYLKRKKVYDDYKTGLSPYFKVNYLYPYELPFEYKFDLKECAPYISLNVKHFRRDVDVYTLLEFQISGYTKADSFWSGPSWENRIKHLNAQRTLPVLNSMLLYLANSTPGKFRPLFCIEQIMSIDVTQFMSNNEILNSCIATDFSAQCVGGNAPEIDWTQQGALQHLNELIVQVYGSKHFVMQLQQAKNNISAGLYTESFLILCSCSEALIYHWCGELAKVSNCFEEYDAFSKSKISRCDSCEFYDSSKSKEKPDNGMVPTLFKQIDFFETKKIITVVKKRN